MEKLVAVVSAASSVSSAAYVPVIKPVAEDIGAAITLITYGAVVAAVGLGVNLLHKEWVRNPLTIEPLDIPPDLAATGLNGNVLSQQLYDALIDLQRSLRPDDGQSDTSFVELPRLQLDLQLPGTSWSVRGAIRYFKHLIGRPERRLMGEVCRVGKSYKIRIRNASGASIDVPVRFHSPADVTDALRSTAECALSLIAPLDAAAIFMSLEDPSQGHPRTLENLQAHLASAATDTHQDAYVMWASVLRKLGDESGMQAKLDLARATPSIRGISRQEGRLGVRYLNFMGSLHRERRDFVQAEQCFSLALTVAPRSISAVSNLGLLHFDRGNLAVAKQWFERAVKEDDRSSRGHRGLGLIAQAEGDLRAATAYFTRAIDLAPRAPWPRLNLCEALRFMGNLAAAEYQLDALQHLDPMFSRQYRTRSRILQDRGQLTLAIKSAQQAIALDARDPWAWHDRAQIALIQGDVAEALASSGQVIQLRPELPEGYRSYAWALQQSGDMDAAIAMIERGLKLADDMWMSFDHAEMLYFRGGPAKALAILEKASRRWPERVDVWRRLAKWHRFHGHPQDVEACLWRAVQASPRDVHSWCDLGEMQRKVGQRDNALQSLARAQDTWSNPARPLCLQAQLHFDRFEYREAEKSLREAVVLQPEHIGSRLELVGLLAKQERYEEASQLCDVEGIEGTQAATLLRRSAWLLYDRSDSVGARRKMDEATAVAPHVLDSWLDLSRLCRMTWDLSEARRTSELAVLRWPGVPDAWVVLGEACASNNDLAGTHSAFDRALTLAPDAGWIAGVYVTALRRYGDEALRTAEALLHRCPSSLDVRLRAADLLVDRLRHSEALQLLDEAAAASTGLDDRALLRKAEVLLELGDQGSGIRTAQSVLARRPNSIRAIRILAQCYKAKGEGDLAEEQLRAALARDPFDVDARLDLAKWMPKAQAKEVLEEGLQQNPHSIRLRRELLKICMEEQDMQSARIQLDELLAMRPTDVDDLLQWSEDVRRLEFPDAAYEASRAMTLALERQPTSARVWLRQSQLSEIAGDLERALIEARRALDLALQPLIPSIVLKVANQLIRLDSTDTVMQLVDQIMNEQPKGDPWLLGDAASVYAEAGLWDRCVSCLRTAIELRPGQIWLRKRLHHALRATQAIS
ncbi:tetratricopeptide repeat protein [Ralstonia pickettii]|uniref:Tetratricopeptide repeat protein n=1 Tax=Ralstonia pickettii TaxID=329 RepID=A0A7X2LBU2_RALPI|nr:tetratricopeptide repeat protein [Ralstonia pickettii]MRT00685.1 tetratricopeptide repeat protein [Ralstonia pickettii]